MPKVTFKSNETYLPITAQQFQDLTNEILKEINKFADPHFLEADYFAQVLMSTIHSYDHKIGFVKKSELFASCMNRISCHLTYNVVQEIQARLKAKADQNGETTTTLSGATMTPVDQENAEVLQ